MKIISHRGNLFGADPSIENTIRAIDAAIYEGLDVEIDLWYIENKFYLGHDYHNNKIDFSFLEKKSDRLWIHCKNLEAIIKMKETDFNYFWHESDTVTLTSHRHIWAYVGMQPIPKSIAVMPELHTEQDLSYCFGICSDYPIMYKSRFGA